MIDNYTHFMYIDDEIAGYIIFDIEQECWYVIHCTQDPMWTSANDETIIGSFPDIEDALNFLEEGLTPYAEAE